MQIKLEISDYDIKRGLALSWQSGAKIEARIIGGEVIFRCNHAGLLSMASHLLTLAQRDVPAGEHFHLDDSNGLEEGSCAVVVERI